MRLPSLAFHLVVIIILIALTEYACHALPTASSQGIVVGLLNATSVVKRQNDGNYTSTIVTIVTQCVTPNAVFSILDVQLMRLVESEEPKKLLALPT